MNGGKGSDFEFRDGKIVRQMPEATDDKRPKISSETETRRMLENYREKRARKTAVRRTVGVCVILAVVAVIIAAAVLVFFRISDVSISGSARYGEQELEEALGLSPWSNLFLTNMGTLRTRLHKAYPSLDRIEIRRQLPDKLVITVTDSVGAYYMKMGGDVYTMTSSLRITERGSFIPEGCRELILCDIKSAVIGNTVEFKTDTTYNYLTGLLSKIETHDTENNINRIDMSGKFDIRLRYQDRFIIMIGDAENAELKLKAAESIISMQSDDVKGVIDCKDASKCSLRKTDDVN
ncbi:MAG: FtsQ-type POTRA domain-containing protein [Clostridia bacterium]|nr:FtsQ-type POTRA domain-containing protein [Clostridia bacterium]